MPLSPRPTAVLRAATILLAAAAATAVAAPPVSDLRELPGDAVVGPAWGDQSTPDLALGAGTLLAVWSDARADQGKWDIHGARLGADGTPLDAVSFPIGDADGSQVTPQVAWNGSHWLVAWIDDGHVAVVRVAPDGAVLGPATRIAQPGSGAALALASDGTGWAVAWAGTAAGNAAVRGARIAPDGSVADPGGLEILPEQSFVRASLTLAHAADRWLLAWPEWTSDRGWDVLGHSLDAGLVPREPAPMRLASSVDDDGAPALASDGSSFYLAWKQQDRNGWVNGISGTTISIDGIPGTPDGTPLGDRRSWGDLPDAAWDGAQWVVAWAADGVFACRVTPSGTPLDPAGVRVSSSSAFDLRDAAVAGMPGGGARLLWQDYRNRRENDIWSGAVDAAGTSGTDAPASLGLPSQQDPKLAWNGDGYGLAFLSRTSQGSRILVARLDADGMPLTGEPVEVARGEVVEPGIAWSGSRYLVTWQDRSRVQVQARRLAADLSPQDAAPFDVVQGENPSVAALGDVFLVTAERPPGTQWQFRDVYGQRVDGATAALVGANIPLVGAFAWGSTAGTVGDRWLVAWEGHQAHDDTIFRIAASFVDAGGVPTGATGLAGGSGWGVAGLSIASHATLGALAYSTTRAPSASAGEIFVVRIGADGALPDGPDGVALTAADGEQSSPSIAWDGSSFVTAFEDTRDRPGLWSFPRTDVFAGRMGADGALLDGPGGFGIERAPEPERQPAVAGAAGRSVVVSSRFVAPVASALRLGLRALGEASGPAPPPVTGLRWADPATLAWDPLPGMSYDVVRGRLEELWRARSIADAACVADDLGPATLAAPDAAPPGGAYYLVRADAAGAPAGTWDDPGTATGASRDGAAGPAACADSP